MDGRNAMSLQKGFAETFAFETMADAMVIEGDDPAIASIGRHGTDSDVLAPKDIRHDLNTPLTGRDQTYMTDPGFG